ncbi:hypothetical protein [Desulfobulbus elongatus]|uniref:hypothetical protein n=1 Tax=Desulfobulbus elongatus TaxID=53332 RepID=UPI000484A291|nr:hypothetical protein [Desulfobulbus elongatus]
MKINIHKLKKLKNRWLTGKGAILFLLNRKVAAMTGDGDFGELTDLRLDRAEKNLVLEVSRGLHVNTIAIRGYGVVTRRGTPYLTWKSAQCDGPDSERYAQVFRQRDGIELSKRSVAVVEAIL